MVSGLDVVVGGDLEVRQDFELSGELQRFAIVQVKVGDARLGNRQQVLLLGFLAEIARHQRLHKIALDFVGETLADHGGRHLALAEAGDARQFRVAAHDLVALVRSRLRRESRW